MKRGIQSLLCACLVAPGVGVAADTYKIDPAHTYPNFKVNHLGFSVMSGQFEETSGTIVMDREGGDSSVEVTIQAASIDTGHKKRDKHLRDKDFFNVDEYPTITYESDDVTFHDDGTATVDGELTLLGTTKPVKLDVDRIQCGEHPMNDDYVCGFNAETTIERTAFGMDKYAPSIGDEIDIRIEAEAVRQ